ncbi:uncharacterized protein [Clytia hemisphaerica]|uniref:G-protein coupled receptors family 2 profile 2 domain-containing protein n=1 Tax=Clytia hemisphaerica TaxID=252671 RepID=A0A7M6DLY5_9CNID
MQFKRASCWFVRVKKIKEEEKAMQLLHIVSTLLLVSTCYAQGQPEIKDLLDCSLLSITDDECLKIFVHLYGRCFQLGNQLSDIQYVEGAPPNANPPHCPDFIDRVSWQCIPRSHIDQKRTLNCTRPGFLNPGEKFESQCVVDIKNVQLKYDLSDMNDKCKRPEGSDDVIKENQLLFMSEFGLSSKRLFEYNEDVRWHQDAIDKIHKTFRFLDLFICVAAFIALLVLIPMKNERVMLHRHLLLAFAFNDIIILYMLFNYSSNTNANFFTAMLNRSIQEDNVDCSMVHVVHYYFFLSQITWMFNELFYQFRQIFNVFTVHKSYIWLYIAAGWGFPYFVVFGLYLPFNWHNPPIDQFLSCWSYHSTHEYNFIVTGPAIFLLALNVFMMTYLMWIIWSKLRINPTKEYVNSRKSARSFLVILVLLGGGYLFTIYGPSGCIEFDYFIILVLPIQGSLIAIFHVFLSREVTDSIKKRFRHWQSDAEFRNSEYSQGRRISLFGYRRGSRNTSITTLSSFPPSRKTSRKESTISFPSIIESDMENSTATTAFKNQNTTDNSIASRNVAEDGFLPPAPPPILGPMSYIRDRDFDSTGGFEKVDVNMNRTDSLTTPSGDIDAESKLNTDDLNNNISFQNDAFVQEDESSVVG